MHVSMWKRLASETELDFLTLIIELGPVGTRELGARLNISPSAARQTATKLEKKGFIVSSDVLSNHAGRPPKEYRASPQWIREITGTLVPAVVDEETLLTPGQRQELLALLLQG